MAIAPRAHQALAPIVTVRDAVGLPTMNDPTLTLALGAGHGPSGCIATLDEQYGEESPPLMASYPAFSNFQSDGLYFTTTLSSSPRTASSATRSASWAKCSGSRRAIAMSPPRFTCRS